MLHKGILRSMGKSKARHGMMWRMRWRNRRRMMRKRKRRKRSEQWQAGEGPLEGGVGWHNMASWSYLLHRPPCLFLAFVSHGGRTDESES